jgi:TonB family protein
MMPPERARVTSPGGQALGERASGETSMAGTIVAVVAMLLGTSSYAPASPDDCARVDAAACRQSCEGGEARACFLLGHIYRYGAGVERDEARARALFEKACDGGEAGACVSLGDAYASGVGIPRDERQATGRYRQACEGGNAVGCIALRSLSPLPVMDYDRPPRAIDLAKPIYPPEAFNKKIEGTVELEIAIDATGKVTGARVLKSVPGLDEAALATVYQWRFEPAIKNGQPVATIARAPVSFRIYERPPAPKP